MPRPPGKRNSNLHRRMLAYEMYARGKKKAEIARELGITKVAVGRWAVQDRWEERLRGVIETAEQAVDHALGDQVAAILATLRGSLGRRVAELEDLCNSRHDATRIKAIQTWFKLAGVDRVIPAPDKTPKGPTSIRLIEDLLEERDS